MKGDEEMVHWLLDLPDPDHRTHAQFACGTAEIMGGRRLLVAYALAAYGDAPVTEALVEATLAQVNACFGPDPLLELMRRDAANRLRGPDQLR